MAERVDTIVVGGGQAGLSTSWHPTRRGVEHAVLERGRVGQEWRQARWDSFVLNTPNWAQQLPGFAYAGPEPDAFAPLAEVIAYLEDYAASFAAPVREGVSVTALRARPEGGYELDTEGGAVHAGSVVVATGAYQRPTPSPLRDAAPPRGVPAAHGGVPEPGRAPMAPSSSSAAASPAARWPETCSTPAGPSTCRSVRARGCRAATAAATSSTGWPRQAAARPGRHADRAECAGRMQPRCERH